MQIRDDYIKIRDFSPARDPYTNTSMLRAHQILQCLSNDINTNSEIAKYCNYSTSTVHRILQVMKKLRWVIQDNANNKYYLGPAMTELASNTVATHRYLIANSLKEMARLALATQETVNLVTMVQLHYILLHEIPSRLGIKITDDSNSYGQLFPVAATGKVLISQINDEEIVEILENVYLPQKMEQTVTDRKTLIAQLREIRQQGYAVTIGERIRGAIGVSAPIANYFYPVALTIIGPEARIRPVMDHIIRELTASAARICGNIAMLKSTEVMP